MSQTFDHSIKPVDAKGFASFHELLAKAKAARPLTAAEKVTNAEALTEMAADSIVNQVDQAHQQGFIAYRQGAELHRNPYCGEDMPLAWEAWNEGWNEAAAGLESDA